MAVYSFSAICANYNLTPTHLKAIYNDQSYFITRFTMENICFAKYENKRQHYNYKKYLQALNLKFYISNNKFQFDGVF